MPLPDTHLSLPQLLAKTAFVVEATDFERFCLWQARHHRLKWSDQPFGFSVTVAQVLGMPVVVSLTFMRVEGQLVLFYEATSQVVDHREVEAWLEKNVPVLCPNREGRRSRTDANNFHICEHALADLNQRAAAEV